jgi:hypothetical protein
MVGGLPRSWDSLSPVTLLAQILLTPSTAGDTVIALTNNRTNMFIYWNQAGRDLSSQERHRHRCAPSTSETGDSEHRLQPLHRTRGRGGESSLLSPRGDRGLTGEAAEQKGGTWQRASLASRRSNGVWLRSPGKGLAVIWVNSVDGRDAAERMSPRGRFYAKNVRDTRVNEPGAGSTGAYSRRWSTCAGNGCLAASVSTFSDGTGQIRDLAMNMIVRVIALVTTTGDVFARL